MDFLTMFTLVNPHAISCISLVRYGDTHTLYSVQTHCRKKNTKLLWYPWISKLFFSLVREHVFARIITSRRSGTLSCSQLNVTNHLPCFLLFQGHCGSQWGRFGSSCSNSSCHEEKETECTCHSFFCRWSSFPVLHCWQESRLCVVHGTLGQPCAWRLPVQRRTLNRSLVAARNDFFEKVADWLLITLCMPHWGRLSTPEVNLW